MHTFNNAVGLEHKKFAAILRFHHGAIISGGNNNRFFFEGKTRQKLIKKLVFAELTKFH
jgi:hypothetical protein